MGRWDLFLIVRYDLSYPWDHSSIIPARTSSQFESLASAIKKGLREQGWARPRSGLLGEPLPAKADHNGLERLMDVVCIRHCFSASGTSPTKWQYGRCGSLVPLPWWPCGTALSGQLRSKCRWLRWWCTKKERYGCTANWLFRRGTEGDTEPSPNGGTSRPLLCTWPVAVRTLAKAVCEKARLILAHTKSLKSPGICSSDGGIMTIWIS